MQQSICLALAAQLIESCLVAFLMQHASASLSFEP